MTRFAWSSCKLVQVALVAICTLGVLAASGSSVRACETGGASRFPLRVEQGKRYLLDAHGKPFFIHGDTAWSIIAQLTTDDAELYLRDRAARGFNTILVSLLEHKFASNAPANIAGDKPFVLDGDYATPNEAYFKHADAILRLACEMGILVLLTPSYAGYEGGSEGWYQEMVQNGPDKLYDYGRFLGSRYQAFPNILWVAAGDYDPPDKQLIRAIARGIGETNPQALQTAHGAPASFVSDYWSDDQWLSLANVYTYQPVFQAALTEFTRGSKPFFLIESAYENMHNAGEQRLRTQAYQAILSGASGHIFGNDPIWHFDGPGQTPPPSTWKQALDSPGARSMTTLVKLISSVDWWKLVPDVNHKLLLDGLGGTDARTVAAMADDGSFALVYLPIGRSVTLNLATLAGPRISAFWHDPASGRVREAEGSPFPPGAQTFIPTRENSSNLPDWILELTSVDDEAQTR